MDYLEAESAVLGACLADSGCIGDVADFLTNGDFYNEQHREIYSSMLDLWSVGEPVSDLTVISKLKEKKKLKLAGGEARISELTLVLPDVANVDYYAKEVKRNSLGRRLKNIGKIMETAEGDPHEILSNAMEQLVDASASSLRSVPENIGEHVSRVYDRAIKLHKKEIKNEVLLTGMPRFDTITGGLKGSDLIIIGARPSVGKSAFSIHLSKILAERGHRVLFFSLEMSLEQIATRMLAAESGVPYSRIQDGYLSKAQPDILKEANLRIKNLPMLVDDKSGQTITDIRTKARREQVRGGVDLVVVDYIQIAANDSTDYQAVTSVSNGLKALAKDLDIPVIGLSQLSRNIENRDNRKPMLSDLKQSGSLEQDADMCFFLWYPNMRKSNQLSLVLAKNRNGALGEVMFDFKKDTQVFTEIGSPID